MFVRWDDAGQAQPKARYLVSAEYIVAHYWMVQRCSQGHIAVHELGPVLRHVKRRGFSPRPSVCALLCLTAMWLSGVIFQVSSQWFLDNDAAQCKGSLLGSYHCHVTVGDSELDDGGVLALEDSKKISVATCSLTNLSTYYTVLHLLMLSLSSSVSLPFFHLSFSSFSPLNFSLRDSTYWILNPNMCHRNAGRNR